MRKYHENKVEVLQVRLKAADMQIKDLQSQLDGFKSNAGHDALA